jgi:glutathione reductase (NADPH)
MAQSFDLVVIGTGGAAATVAFECRAAGWTVAIVDSRPFGGTCALRGCDPKKVLVGAGEVVDWVRRMAGKGMDAPDIRIAWPDLMRFKRTFTDPVPQAREKAFAEAGIVALHGRARFTGPAAVRVADQTLEARHVVIAAGARPAPLHIPGEELLITSDEFLDLDELPRRIAFVGGGYIAFEFAHLASRAGAQVTILHRGARPLELFDPDLVDRLVARTRRLGVDVRLGAPVRAVEDVDGVLRVHAGEGVVAAELVVHAAGRTPNIADLDLPAAGVESEPRGVKVNEFLQSVSNPAVYAAGDCAASGGPPLTPVAGYEARIVATNLLEGNRVKPSYAGVASIVFTVPPLGTVGLREDAARSQGLHFQVHHADTAEWYSSRRVAEECSGYKVLIEDETERILGAHILGNHAEDVTNVFALAIRAGLRASQLKDTLFGYPTHESDIQYML